MAVARLLVEIVRERVDVVHCHNMLAYTYGGVAALLASRRAVILTKHGTTIPGNSLASSINRVLAHRAQLVAVSDEVREALSQFAHRQVHVIANGVSLTRFPPDADRSAARDAASLPGSALLVGVVARLSSGKGHVSLVRAFRHVANALPEMFLLLVGDGPQRPEIEQAVEAAGLSGRVLLLGARHDVPSLLAALDVFVLPSDNEGLPIAVLEAMAARLPVIATRVGGVPEAVEDGITGLLIPPGDDLALASAIRRLARSPDLRASMGNAGRMRVEQRFSISRTLSEYERLYVGATAR